MKLEGNLMNRIMEGRDTEGIKVDTDITMYYYSDRTCYYVTEVMDPKHIKVRQYIVLPDYSSEPMSNDWKYFKTQEEADAYFSETHSEHLSSRGCRKEETWTYRYGNWWYTYEAAGKKVYRELGGKVSFGRRDYYYDYEF